MKAAFLVTVAFITRAALAAPTTQVVFNFHRSVGENPTAPLLERGGAYFMTLSTGGSPGCIIHGLDRMPCGTILRLDPPNAQHASWRGKLIYRFENLNFDGAFPQGMPIPYNHGNLLATTFRGGMEGPYGTLVELTPPQSGAKSWTERVLHSFGPSDGFYNPNASVHVDAQGNVFMTVEFGGSCNCGGVVEFSPPVDGQGPWKETIVKDFNGSDGYWPTSGIIADTQGNLYLTSSVGTQYYGMVIELTPPSNGQSSWTDTIIHGFNGGANDGSTPFNGLVADKSGNLYGLTSQGGPANAGVAYKLTPPTGGATQWGFQLLYAFTGGADGGTPSRGLAIDAAGNVFATTTKGGDPTCQCGTLVKLTPPQSGQGPYTETTLHAFTGTPDGAQPSAITVEDNGNLLIPTFAGGTANEGALIEVTNSGFATHK